MDNIAIIIPSRLNAERLPNKPLKLINNKEMILHVYDVAKDSNVGQVVVATPDKIILELIKKHNGQAVLTSNKHETGTDRIFEVFEKKLNSKLLEIVKCPSCNSKKSKNYSIINYFNQNSTIGDNPSC